jgi:hypothetical protein
VTVALLRWQPRASNLRLVLLGIDVLRSLQRRGETRQSLAGILGGDEVETQGVLDLLLGKNLITLGVAEWAGSRESAMAIYTISPSGRELYETVLDRFAQEISQPGSMSCGERYLLVLCDRATSPLRERLLGMLDELPEPTGARRPVEALVLAGAAVRYAKQALEASGDAEAAVAGLASLSLAGPEELGYVAKQLSEYAKEVSEPSLHAVIDSAAAACDAAWEVRRLGPRDPDTGVSRERAIDDSSYLEIAEEAASALWTLGEDTEVDVAGEAAVVICALGARG